MAGKGGRSTRSFIARDACFESASHDGEMTQFAASGSRAFADNVGRDVGEKPWESFASIGPISPHPTHPSTS
jgi:hypothetical protein